MAPKGGPLGLAFAAWKVWRRLPTAQRAQVLRQVKRHGPRAAAAAATLVRSRRR